MTKDYTLRQMWLARNFTRQITQLLPGQNKKHIQIQSRRPIELIEELKTLTSYDSLFLEQGDVWRYGNDPTLIEYFQSCPQKFYVITMGYQHRKICDNAYELACDILSPKSYYPEFKTKSFDTKINFGCLNRNSRFHRTWLGLKLWQKNLVNNVIYTLHNITENTDYLQARLSAETGWEEFKKQVPFKYSEEDGQQADWNILHPAHSTFCNIVTESETEFFGYDKTWPTPVITEKSYKPFLSCQIPIYLTAQGHLAYLKKFGFDVFEDILPPGYDNMDTFAKVDAIVDLVANCPIREIYFDSIDRIRHNHELVISGKIEKQIIDEIQNFVYNN